MWAIGEDNRRHSIIEIQLKEEKKKKGQTPCHAAITTRE
jgi:hypothetical protein